MTGDFVLDWERALGYRSDPFVDKILEPASKFLVNRVDEKEKVNWFFIKGYFFGSIIGEHGVGKTMFLKWLMERLERYERIHCVYINAAIFREQINLVNQILHPLMSFYEKTWSRPHQKFVNFDHVGFLKKKLGTKSVALLIDNAHNLTDRNMELIKSFREEGLKIHVIVSTTQSDYEKSRLPEFGNDELNINLRRLTLEESKEMLKRRMEACGGVSTEPFTDEELRILYEKADKNPRQFIHLCRDEAIKILLQKRERQSPVQSSSHPVNQNLPRHIKKKPEVRSFNVDYHEPKHSEPPQNNSWKSPLKFKFNMEKQPEPTRRDNQSIVQPQPVNKFRPIPQDKKIVGNSKYSSDLLDQLTSARPKKKQGNDSDS